MEEKKEIKIDEIIKENEYLKKTIEDLKKQLTINAKRIEGANGEKRRMEKERRKLIEAKYKLGQSVEQNKDTIEQLQRDNLELKQNFEQQCKNFEQQCKINADLKEQIAKMTTPEHDARDKGTQCNMNAAYINNQNTSNTNPFSIFNRNNISENIDLHQIYLDNNIGLDDNYNLFPYNNDHEHAELSCKNINKKKENNKNH